MASACHQASSAVPGSTTSSPTRCHPRSILTSRKYANCGCRPTCCCGGTAELVQYVPFHRRAWHAGASSWQGRERCNDYLDRHRTGRHRPFAVRTRPICDARARDRASLQRVSRDWVPGASWATATWRPAANPIRASRSTGPSCTRSCVTNSRSHRHEPDCSHFCADLRARRDAPVAPARAALARPDIRPCRPGARRPDRPRGDCDRGLPAGRADRARRDRIADARAAAVTPAAVRRSRSSCCCFRSVRAI